MKVCDKCGIEIYTVDVDNTCTECRKKSTIYLVEIQPGGLGRGYSDVFTADEIEEIEDGV